MAPAVPSWKQVLDDADSATANLIVRLHLEDVEAAERDTRSPLPKTSTPSNLPKVVLPPHLRRPKITFKCVICEEDFDNTDHCCRLPCEHYHCTECLNLAFLLAVKDESSFPPRCCGDAIALARVHPYLISQLTTEYETRKQEMEDKHRTYCSHRLCSTYISQENKLGPIGTCAKCGRQTCILCKQAIHDGDCVKDKAVEQTMQLVKEKKWQKCPKCERIVEITSGCNHITCICKTQFCYICAAKWKSCTCPQWVEEYLLDNGRRIV